MGTVPETQQQYNYSVTSPNSGSSLADGALIPRHFHANEFEYFVQDAWRVTSHTDRYIRHSPFDSSGPLRNQGAADSPYCRYARVVRKRGEAAKQGEVFEDTSFFHAERKSQSSARVLGRSKKPISLRDSPWCTHQIPGPHSAPEQECTSTISDRAS